MLNQKCICCKIATILVIIGALNWGLIGVADFNFVEHFFGMASMATRIIYVVVGLAGLGMLWGCFKECPMCKK